MRMFPTLFKLDSKGNIRVWNITANNPPGTYRVSHGAYQGKAQETTVSVIQKNIGKVNETSLAEQAELEAESKWKKQQDKGYVVKTPVGDFGDFNKNMSSAKSLLPMLAKSFKDDGDKIVFPCYYQPKLDGVRCLSSQISAVTALTSRKGKVFNRIPHIEEAIDKILNKYPDWVFDGELYTKGMNFQAIVSIVKKSKTTDEIFTSIEYHVYDCYQIGGNHTYEERKAQLDLMLQHADLPIQRVLTAEIDEDEVAGKLVVLEKMGYEGMMLRNKLGTYENDRRSPHLQKLKSFIDEEFVIVGGKEGKGKFAGMCCFRCVTEEGKEFDVMPMGSEAQRKDYWKNLNKYIGKSLTVKYFERTNDNIPRFPVGVCVRDYE